jgi:superkiller protein 3
VSVNAESSSSRDATGVGAVSTATLQADDLLDEGDYKQAEAKFREALAIDAKHASAVNGLGSALQGLGQTDDAMAAYEKAAALWRAEGSDDAKLALRNWGNLLVDDKHYERGEAKLREALAIDTKYASAANGLGRALQGLGQTAQAMAAYEQAAALWRAEGSDNAKVALQNWSNLLLDDEQYKQAEAKFREILAIDPKYAAAFDGLGRALQGLGQTDAAMAAYENAVVLWRAEGSDNAKVTLQNWGYLLLDGKQFKQAEAKFREALAIDAKYASAVNGLGRALRGLGKTAEAMAAYEQAAALWRAEGSDNAKIALQDWGYLLLDENQFEPAKAKFREILAIDAKYASALDGVGRALRKLGQTPEAMAAYEQAAALWRAEGSDNAKIALQNWGYLLLDEKQFKQAEAKFREALAIDAKHAPAVDGVGRALQGLGKTAEAVAAYEQAAALWREEGSDDTKIALQDWGYLLLDDNQFEQAEAKFREILAIHANYAPAVNGLGRALQGLGQAAGALAAYEQAAALWSEQGSADAKFALQNWGGLLEDVDDFEAAVAKFRQAVALAPDDSATWFSLAHGLGSAGVFDESIDAYGKSAKLDRKDPYALHNRADTLMDIGRYRESWAEWQAATEAYETCVADSPRSRLELDQASNFAWVLADVFNDWQAAESRYRSVLANEPDNANALVGLVKLYEAWTLTGKPSVQALARQPLVARQSAQALKKRLGAGDDMATWLSLAEVAMATGDYAEAASCLSLAEKLTGDVQSRKAGVAQRQGILFARQERYDGAIGCFQQALRRWPANLKLRTNLAEAFVKAKQLDKAEGEYRRVLAQAPGNIEALVGMGQLCIDLAEGGDNDRLADAEKHLMDAIDNGATSRAGSKRLLGKELAQVKYLVGYARVKMFEAEPGPRTLYLLEAAQRNFRDSRELDASNYKARAAADKLTKRLRASRRDQLAEWLGPALVCVLSLTVFAFAHYDFHYAVPAVRRLDAVQYIAITFGALVFFVAGLYLPKVLKLKVPGIELEKASMDQISIATSIGIRK